MRLRPTHLAVIAAVVLPLAPAAAVAQGTDSPGAQASPCPPNAALAYWRAWNTRVPAMWENTSLEKERMFEAEWTPSATVAANLEAAQSDIEAVIAASRMEHCDWGVNIDEEGAEAILPHLAKLRTTGRVLLADSRRLSARGDIAGAVERLAALLRLSLHLRTDHTVNSVMTGQRLAADTALPEMRRLAEAGKLDDATRAVLLEALEKASGSDPWGMREALRHEPRMFAVSVKRACRGPEAAGLFMQKFAPRAKPEERAQSGIDQLTDAEIHAHADRAFVAYEEVLAMWDLPEAVQQIRQLDADKKSGTYGAVAALTGSDLGHMRVIVGRVEFHVAETKRIVSGLPPSDPAPGK